MEKWLIADLRKEMHKSLKLLVIPKPKSLGLFQKDSRANLNKLPPAENEII